MPEKVHIKFSNDADDKTKITQPSSASDTITSKLLSPKHTPYATPNGSVNGTKRLRDGSPKTISKRKKLSTISDAEVNGASSNSNTSTPSINGTSEKKQSITQKGILNGSATNQVGRIKSVGEQNGKQRSSPKPNGSEVLKNGIPNKKELERAAKDLEKFRKSLPVFERIKELRYALRTHDVLLLTAETGSGKSTQIPQFMYDQPWCQKQTVKIKNAAGNEEDISVGGVIAITQPRRVAAITLARRVAKEMGSYLGPVSNTPGKVGYSIKFVTEGTLLQEMVHDPYLRKYSAVIVDEIHERGVDVDLIAGFLRQLIHGPKTGRGGIPLKVIIMSATLDLGGYEAFFAKPGSVPDYKPGSNYGAVLAPHLQNDEVVKREAKPMLAIKSVSRRSSTDSAFSAWSGFSSSDDDKKKEKGKEKDEAQDFEEYDTGVAVEEVQGRKFPVQLFFDAPPNPNDYADAMFRRLAAIHVTEPLPGDILVFLPGQEEIEHMQIRLEVLGTTLSKEVPKIKVLPLFGALPPEAQQLVFEPLREKMTRKIVLATNIAETSVTVPGVRYVVDSCRAKVKKYRTKLGFESLLTVPISKQSALQRMGRAGREAPGKCWRAVAESEYVEYLQDEIPEILRCDVLEAVLKMKARGVQDVINFPLMDSPDVDAMKQAIFQLNAMGALDDEGNLTEDGKKMSAFPLPASYGRALIAAASPEFNCVLNAIDVISLLTSDSQVFLQERSQEEVETTQTNRADIIRREGDLLTYLTTMQRYAAENTNRLLWCKDRNINNRAMRSAMSIRKQLRALCLQHKLLSTAPPPDPQPFEPATPEESTLLIRCFLKAFGDRTATLAPDGSYVTVKGKHNIVVHPQSVLWGRKVEAIMFLEHVYTNRNWAKKVSVVQIDWVVDALGGMM
ncbi:Salivary acidic proline-rich phosphoprotein 1/2 [Clarireedia jacksonii]